MGNLFKVNKVIGVVRVSLLLTLIRFHMTWSFSVSTVDFEQVNVGWVWWYFADQITDETLKIFTLLCNYVTVQPQPYK